MVNVVILTSSYTGTAAHHLPYLIEGNCCNVKMVIVNTNLSINKKKKFIRIVKKVSNIGLLGALNGIRMRSWYTELSKKYITIPDIRTTCTNHEIPIYAVNAINSKLTEKLFIESNADIGLSLGNPYISERIFRIPLQGMLNIHHEILPDYQNAQSIIWQIYNNSSCTGYTIHKIDANIDTGDILYQKKVPIIFKNSLAHTVAATSSVLLKESAIGLVEVIKNYSQYEKLSQRQRGGNKYTTPTFLQFLKIYYRYRKLRQLQK